MIVKNKELLKNISDKLQAIQEECTYAIELENDNELNTDVDVYAKVGDAIDIIEDILESQS